MVFLIILIHFFIKKISNDSHIILTFGSVPDGLTSNLPLPLISLFASLIAFLQSKELITFLFFTFMLMEVFGLSKMLGVE